MKKPIILASASPRRLALMRQIGLEPEVMISDIKEHECGQMSKTNWVMDLALKKAQKICQQVQTGIIIGADTVVVKGNRVYGKPRNEDQAIEMLGTLAGKTHQVITGVAVIDWPKGQSLVDYEETLVVFRELSVGEIQAYVNMGESLDKAAGYGIQGRGALLVKKINGDYGNVVGLPLQTLAEMLKKIGWDLLPSPLLE